MLRGLETPFLERVLVGEWVGAIVLFVVCWCEEGLSED